jgi:hypothetical protein
VEFRDSGKFVRVHNIFNDCPKPIKRDWRRIRNNCSVPKRGEGRVFKTTLVPRSFLAGKMVRTEPLSREFTKQS